MVAIVHRVIKFDILLRKYRFQDNCRVRHEVLLPRATICKTLLISTVLKCREIVLTSFKESQIWLKCETGDIEAHTLNRKPLNDNENHTISGVAYG